MHISFDNCETIGGYRVHPAASVFPLLEGDDFENLVQSILSIGMQHPIVVMRHPDGDILIDGRNRLRAVETAKKTRDRINIPIQEWVDDGRSISEYVFEVNACRRHLTDDAWTLASLRTAKLVALENEARKKASQFQKGNKANPTGTTVATISTPPSKRDSKTKDANSTAGQIAKRAKTSIHKARQAIAVQNAVDHGELPKEVTEDVMSGKKKLRDVLPKKHRKKPENKKHRSMAIILEEIRDLIAEWKDAEHNAAVLKNELTIQSERL